MKIYALDTAVIEEEPIVETVTEDTKDTEDYLPIQDYHEWEEYVTQYKPDMIPTKEFKGRPFAQYLAYRDKINEYCEGHFDQGTIKKVLELYRQLIPMTHIGKELGISPVYISALLRNNMPDEERRGIKEKIRHINLMKYKGRGGIERMDDEKRMPLLVWKAYYVQKKPFEQVAKELKITYERLTRILNAIKVSFAPQVSQF